LKEPFFDFENNSNSISAAVNLLNQMQRFYDKDDEEGEIKSTKGSYRNPLV